MSVSIPSSSFRFAPLVAGVAYFLLATIALLISRFEGGLAYVWLANALLMAELQRSHTRQWPAIILCCGTASMISTSLFGMGVVAAVPMALINIAEALIVVLLCRRFEPNRNLTDASKRPLLVFVLALSIPANMIAALAAAFVASSLTPVAFGASWLQWYSGHVLGGLTFAPILMMFFQGEARRWSLETPRRDKWEALALLAFFAVVTGHVFYLARYPMLFVLLLPMVGIAFRTGYLGAAASVVILAIIGGMATMTGHGPFHMVPGTMGERIQFLQLFLSFSFLLTIPVAAELNRRRRLFQMLQESEARYRTIAEHSGDVVLELGVDGVVQYASPSAIDQLGCEPDRLIGRDAAEFVDPQDRAEVIRSHRRALAHPGEVQTVEFRPASPVMALDWCEMVTRAVVDERGTPTGVISTIRDMSRHKARQTALQRAAATDSLTGADSRPAFLEKLEGEIRRTANGERSCLLLIDIDHFKSVNDRYGHIIGDKILTGFVARLRPGLRGMDSIGRLGGEEFAILLVGVDVHRASMICERLRAAVSTHPMRTDTGEAISVTFSAGLVELKGAVGATELLEAADKALYRAKHGGRNCLRLAA